MYELNNELIKAAKFGQIELCNFFIDSGAEAINEAFYNACVGGYYDLAVNLININASVNEKKKITSDLNYNLGMSGAAKNGSLELINLMIESGANNFDTCLLIAAKNNNLDITKIMVEKISKLEISNNFYESFNTACTNDSAEVIRYFCENRLISDFNLGFFLVCKNSNQELARYLFEKGATNTNICLYAVCAKGDVEMIKLLISLGANDFTEALKYAATEEIRKLLT